MKGQETRHEIVRIGAEIIGQGGFNATGIDAILKKAKVPKGSFYYYFSSKEDFGLAVIELHAKDFSERMETFLKDTTRSPLERIRHYLDASMAGAETNQCKRGCLIGNLGQELAAQSEKFRKRIQEVFESWRDQLAECLREAVKKGELPQGSDPRQLADFMLTGWEGAILRAKVAKSVKPLKDFTQLLFERVLK